MPVTYINIEWPNQEIDKVYSPSSIISEYLTPGETLSVDEFLKACRDALKEASERVRKKYGYACTSAEAELDRLDKRCKDFQSAKEIKIISIL